MNPFLEKLELTVQKNKSVMCGIMNKLFLIYKIAKMETKKILAADLLDLLFENRNKEYGAYELRKTYNKRITTALIVTASITVVALGSFLFANGSGGKVMGQIRVDSLTLENFETE